MTVQRGSTEVPLRRAGGRGSGRGVVAAALGRRGLPAPIPQTPTPGVRLGSRTRVEEPRPSRASPVVASQEQRGLCTAVRSVSEGYSYYRCALRAPPSRTPPRPPISLFLPPSRRSPLSALVSPFPPLYPRVRRLRRRRRRGRRTRRREGRGGWRQCVRASEGHSPSRRVPLRGSARDSAAARSSSSPPPPGVGSGRGGGSGPGFHAAAGFKGGTRRPSPPRRRGP